MLQEKASLFRRAGGQAVKLNRRIVRCWRFGVGLTSLRRLEQMRTVLYGKKAANLYTQAFVQNTQARALYQESEDTYYRANDAASYDDWRRARHQWDYFYNRH